MIGDILLTLHFCFGLHEHVNNVNGFQEDHIIDDTRVTHLVEPFREKILRLRIGSKIEAEK